MHTKKLIGVLVAMSTLVLLAGCGSAQPGTTTDDTVISGTTETTTVETSTNLSNNQKCIELMAYSLKWASYQAKGDTNGFMQRVKKVDTLVKQYGLTGSDYSDLCKWFVLEPNFMQKVQKRVSEL